MPAPIAALLVASLLVAGMPPMAQLGSASAGAPVARDVIPGEMIPAIARLASADPARASTAVPAGQVMTLTVTLKRSDEAGFQRYLSEAASPSSRLYGHYLSQAQVAARFGPSRAAYRAVLGWLLSQGFALAQGSADRLTITVRGTARAAGRTFATALRTFDVQGRSVYTNTSAPSVPGFLARFISNVAGLNDVGTPKPLGLPWVVFTAHRGSVCYRVILGSRNRACRSTGNLKPVSHSLRPDSSKPVSHSLRAGGTTWLPGSFRPISATPAAHSIGAGRQSALSGSFGGERDGSLGQDRPTLEAMLHSQPIARLIQAFKHQELRSPRLMGAAVGLEGVIRSSTGLNPTERLRLVSRSSSWRVVAREMGRLARSMSLEAGLSSEGQLTMGLPGSFGTAQPENWQSLANECLEAVGALNLPLSLLATVASGFSLPSLIAVSVAIFGIVAGGFELIPLYYAMVAGMVLRCAYDWWQLQEPPPKLPCTSKKCKKKKCKKKRCKAKPRRTSVTAGATGVPHGLTRKAMTDRTNGANYTAAAAAGPQNVGLLEYGGFHRSDVADWLSFLKLSSPNLGTQLSTVSVDGGAAASGDGESETLLDIDTVASLDPAAEIAVYEAPLGTPFEQLFNRMIGDHVTVISNSWAQCEDDTSPGEARAIDSVLAQAEASGITVVNASGDTGSTCLDGSPNTVAVPADSPHAIAVGGTTPIFGRGFTYGGQRWWGSQIPAAGGGAGGFGVSRYFSRPSYQNGYTNASGRSVPDLAVNADPSAGFDICQADAGGCPAGLMWGGTSMAAPEMAALTAKLNTAVGRDLHLVPTSLYHLAEAAGAFYTPATLHSDFPHVGLGAPDFNQWQLSMTGAKIGAVSASDSTAVATLVASASSSPTALVRVGLWSANGFPVGGKSVTVTQGTGDHAVISAPSGLSGASDGTVTFDVSDTVSEIVTFTVKDTTDNVTLTAHPTIVFQPPPATAGSVGAGLGSVPADGTSSTTITVTLLNATGKPAVDKTVSIDEGSGHAIITPTGSTPGVTNSNGRASFTAVDLTAETVTFMATDITDGDVPVPGSAKVDFTKGNGSNQCPAQSVTAAKGFALDTFASGFFDAPVNHVSGCGGIGEGAWDPSGNLYVPDYVTGDVYKFGPAGGSANGVTKITQTPLGAYLAALAFGKNGDLYAYQYFTPPGSTAVCGCIYQLNPATGAIERLVAQNVPATNIYIDPLSGDLLTTSSFNGGPDYSNNIMRIHDPGPGEPTVSCASPAPGTNCSVYANMGGPTGGITFDRDGTLYVGGAWWTSANLWQVSATDSKTHGTITLLDSAISGGGAGPIVLTPGSNGKLPVLAVNNLVNGVTMVEKLNLNQKPLTPTPLIVGGNTGTQGGAGTLGLGPDGCLYVADSNTILKLTSARGRCPYTPAMTPGLGLSLVQGRTQAPTGTSVSFTVHLSGASSPNGVRVIVGVLGANTQDKLVTLRSQGNGSFSYTGAHTGLDAVTATATVKGKSVSSTTLFVHWRSGPHVTFTSLNPSPTQGVAGHRLTVAGVLIDAANQPAMTIKGQTLFFSLARRTCSGMTDGTGEARCSLTLPSSPGASVLRVRYAGSTAYLPSSNSTTFRVLKLVSAIDITGRAVQNGKKLTFTWSVISGRGIAAFDVVATGAKHADVQENTKLIPVHSSASYIFTVQDVKWDVDHFLLEVHTKTGKLQAGPFAVFEPNGKLS